MTKLFGSGSRARILELLLPGDGSRSGIAGISGPDDGGLCPWGDVGQRHVDSGDSIDLDSLFRILQSPISK